MNENRFALRAHMLIEDADDGIILIDSHNGTMWSSNQTARALLTRLQKDASSAELVEALTAAFEVPIMVAWRDVERFLESLSTMGLLDVVAEERTVSVLADLAVA